MNRMVLPIAALALWIIVGCGGSRDSRSGNSSSTSGGAGVSTAGPGSTSGGGNVAVEPGFTPLFDGQTLSGWMFGKDTLDGQTASPDFRFQAKDGIILLDAKDRSGKVGTQSIVSTRSFNKDFILKFDFKATQEASGVFTVRNGGVPMNDFIRRGEQKHFHYFKSDGWNEMEVTIRQVTRVSNKVLGPTDRLEAGFRNGQASATLNGQTIDPNWIQVRLEGTTLCNGEGVTGGFFHANSTGQISFRAVSGKIALRNIRFQELP